MSVALEELTLSAVFLSRSSSDAAGVFGSTREPAKGAAPPTYMPPGATSKEVELGDPLHWRENGTLRFQLVACFVMFITFGFSDQVLGTLLPQLKEHYHVDDSAVSLLFLVQSVGYIIAAFLTERIQSAVGLGGALAGCMGLTLIAFGLACLVPPFGVLCLAYFVCGFGLGAEDAVLNAWTGRLTHASEVMGVLHGTYGLGSFLAPMTVAYMLEHGYTWSSCYWLLIIATLIALGLCYSFRTETASKHHRHNPAELAVEPVSHSETMRDPTVRLFALCIFTYLGAEIGFGAWLVSYTMRVKGQTHQRAAFATSAYWLGITLGRLVLGFCTVWLPSVLATNFIYLSVTMGGVAAVGLISGAHPGLLAALCFVTGFFVGPALPTFVISAAKFFPPRLYLSGISFTIAAAASGAAFFPWILGVINTAVDSLVMMPVVVIAILGVCVGGWYTIYLRFHQHPCLSIK